MGTRQKRKIEWTSEGKQKESYGLSSMGDGAGHFVNNSRHRKVCAKWVYLLDAPSRVAPQDVRNPVPAEFFGWGGIFLFSRFAPLSGIPVCGG